MLGRSCSRPHLYHLLILIITLSLGKGDRCTTEAWCIEDSEDRLMIDLFKEYKNTVRPPGLFDNDSAIDVKVGLQLQLLVNVDEMSQVMHTNIWIDMTWTDPQLAWDLELYHNLTIMRVPSDKIWIPDIVLFNNADGKYEATYFSNALVKYSGEISWVPPAIFKSTCRIDVEHFPFDEQTCRLQMGSWTYGREDVNVSPKGKGIDLSEFTPSSIWDIIDVPVSYNETTNRLDFVITVRRKPFFYCWVIFIPSVLFAAINFMVFYMPTESHEKIGLAIYVLVAIDFYLLMVTRILPPSSLSIPWITKYQIISLVLNETSIFIQVIIINIYYREPSTVQMPKRMSTKFLNLCGTLLCMKRPKQKTVDKFVNHKWAQQLALSHATQFAAMTSALSSASNLRNKHHPKCPYATQDDDISRSLMSVNAYGPDYARKYPSNLSVALPTGLNVVLERLAFITKHMRDEEESKGETDNWRYAAMILDRLFLYIFFAVTLGGTVLLILSVPNIFDIVDAEKKLNELYAMYNYRNISG